MHPAPFTLEVRRIAHAAELFEVLRDPRLYEFLDEDPPASVQALADKLARSESRQSPDGKEHWLNWVVRTASGAIAGYVQATVEEDKATNVAYVFSPAHQGQGIATAAVARMLELVAADYQPAMFFIVADAGNVRSLKVAQRLGFSPAPAEVAATRPTSPNDVVYWRRVAPA